MCSNGHEGVVESTEWIDKMIQAVAINGFVDNLATHHSVSSVSQG